MNTPTENRQMHVDDLEQRKERKFNPADHLIDIKGKDYLQVAWRLVWFREVHPDWSIETEPYRWEPSDKWVVFKATIKDDQGRTITTGYKTEAAANLAPQMKSEYFEKAETGAIGRALALAGFGTQFTGYELDEFDRIVDSPL
jgi:hypothetical protein